MKKTADAREISSSTPRSRSGKTHPDDGCVERQHSHYQIDMEKGEMVDELQLASSGNSQTVLIISSTSLGKGEDHLGTRLMSSFFYSLLQLGDCLKTVIFINSGVFLATEGSEILGYLQHMEERGTEIYSSQTCLSHYNLLEKLEVGSTCTMFAIAEKITEARRLITF